MIYPRTNDRVLVPKGTPNGTLFVCVDKTYGKGIRDTGTNQLVSLKDCAMGYWTDNNLQGAHGYDCQWVMARCRGRIVGVWKIDSNKGWRSPAEMPKETAPNDCPTDGNRKGCALIDVGDDIKNQFVGKVVHLGRSHNPLRGYFIG